MTIESSVAALTTSTSALTTAVGIQQLAVTAAVNGMTSVTTRVNNGLNNVDNTRDIDKPVSTATASALAVKQATLVSGLNISTVNGQSLLSGEPLVIARSATSLNTVAYDNRATLRAASPQLDDSIVVEGLGLFMWATTQAEPDDDESCFNTLSGQWLLRLPDWELVDAWSSVNQSKIEARLEDVELLLGISRYKYTVDGPVTN
jgi:hypothetical protein